jgi:serine/threonine protein phosphatase 1
MQTGWIHAYARNTRGTDWVVGDIHGHFTRLQAALDAVGFEPENDRLFACGDLVDRVWHLDTAGWSEEGYFSVMRLEDLARKAIMFSRQQGG